MAIKDIFNKAAKNVANTAATEWASEFDIFKTYGKPEIERGTGKEAEEKKKKTLKEAFKEALAEQGRGKPMQAYSDVYNMLTQVNRNRPRFRGAMVSTGMRIPTRPGQSSFRDVAVKDPRDIARENRERMRKFVLEKAYITKG
jgi:hypothetical protein